VGLILILKPFPIFRCVYSCSLGLDRALTAQDTVGLLDRAQSTHVLNR